MASVLSLLFFSFITFTLLVQARLNLDHSDRDALLTIQKDLSITSQPCLNSLCDSTAGVFCERRISNNSYVLRVTRIVFESQKLKGFISPAIGKLSELKELSLPNNYLIDQIPPQIVDCRKLEVLNLQNNRLSGKVPSELHSLLRLRILDLSLNEFSGNFDFLKSFPNLEKLSLANNMFTGKVPASVRSFRNLRSFNVSGNNFLDGPVLVMNRLEYSSAEPKKRENIPKRYIFAESNNQTSAMAPSASRNNSFFDSLEAPAPSPIGSNRNKHKSKNKKVKGWILGFLAGAVAGAISGTIFSVIFKLLMVIIKGRKNMGAAQLYSQMIKAEDIAFLEKDGGMDDLELIGRGGCGEVYRTDLQGSKVKTIAIKKIIQATKDAGELTEEDTKLLNKKMRQIKSEIQTVGQIRHRNLLSLLAHVPRPECHYLVYEFMKNGSLQDILTQVSEGNRELDWLARHRIAVGVACGLEYLHMSHSPRIIHRDLKPANVLLDDDMEARIADFGLAKAVPDADTHVTSSNVAGTLGYIAPEYYQTMKFTDKCDIYSFGVLLGVLVIGKFPSDEFFQHTSEMSLVKWMRNVMTSEEPKRAIDPKLMENGDEEKMLLVLKIACFCTLDDPKERPNSKDVRCMLDQVKH